MNDHRYETIPQIAREVLESTKNSYASITAKRLSKWQGYDKATVDDAIQCLKDDDKYLKQLAKRMLAAWKREKKGNMQ